MDFERTTTVMAQDQRTPAGKKVSVEVMGVVKKPLKPFARYVVGVDGCMFIIGMKIPETTGLKIV